MVYIAEKLRELVISRAKGLCEYCQTNMHIVAYMEVDHIQPVSKGGQTQPDNLCLSCVNCNRAKSNLVSDDNTLFNPRLDHWHEHFEWDETSTQLLGLTTKGEVTLFRLKINADVVVNARGYWVKAGWHPPTTT